jgi:transposase
VRYTGPHERETKPTTKGLARGAAIAAWELHQKGWQPNAIAEALGVTPGAVSQWLKRGREEGPEALRSRRGGGPKPRLSEAQLTELREHLAKGAEHFGFRGEVRTQPRVVTLIKRLFGVSYHPSHVGRILKKLGWSRQQPVTRASQRDEAAIERWRTETWVELEKKPGRKDAP